MRPSRSLTRYSTPPRSNPAARAIVHGTFAAAGSKVCARALRPVNHAPHDGASHSARAGRTAQEGKDAVRAGRIGRAMTIRAVTFDVYSALYDTPAGLARALTPVLQRRGITGDTHAVARTWRHQQPEDLLIGNSLGREPASNRKAIEASVRYTLRGFEPPVTPDELQALVHAWEDIPPWPEAAARLGGGRRPGFVAA